MKIDELEAQFGESPPSDPELRKEIATALQEAAGAIDEAASAVQDQETARKARYEIEFNMGELQSAIDHVSLRLRRVPPGCSCRNWP